MSAEICRPIHLADDDTPSIEHTRFLVLVRSWRNFRRRLTQDSNNNDNSVSAKIDAWSSLNHYRHINIFNKRALLGCGILSAARTIHLLSQFSSKAAEFRESHATVEIKERNRSR